MFVPDDTIVALSSAAGSSARGIIRLDGPASLACAAQILQCGLDDLVDAGSWSCPNVRCCLAEDVTCPAQIYVFRRPHSYTTQDMLEIHLPGSPPVLQMVIEQLLAAGARPAEPGEFTARAFFNGRIDLTEAEAVAEVINARSDAQLRAAERLLGGQLHRSCDQLRDDGAELLALLEVEIDFSEEDIEFASLDQLRGHLGRIVEALDKLLKTSVNWEDLTHLPRVAVAGSPNAGKSSLVNSLLGFDRSIVSAIAGTTRDLLTAPLALPEGECLVVDTAGLGEVADPLGSQTSQLARQAVASCDLLIWVADVAADNWKSDIIPPADLEAPTTLGVANKIDLLGPDGVAGVRRGWPGCVPVSASLGTNVEALRQRIQEALHGGLVADSAAEALVLTGWQQGHLGRARENLASVAEMLSHPDQVPVELAAVELRAALAEIGAISGPVATEDVLGRIFSRFCVGK